MIEHPDFAYDHDEEALGFGEPETPAAEHPPTLSVGARLGLGVVAAGALALVAEVFAGWQNGTWLGFLASYGALSVGAVLFFWTNRRAHAGIDHDGTFFSSAKARGVAGWAFGVALTLLYVAIYYRPEWLGHDKEGGRPAGLVGTVEALAQAMTGGHASQWFLYGVLYSGAILVFGARMAIKYRHSRYHLIRTGSVAFFQLVFAWFLPNLLVRFQKPYVEFNGVWPLKHDYLWPEKVASDWGFLGAGSLGIFLLVFAVLGVIATPVLTYYFGKRWYCSWVCGCGGLAETLGDPWRHLSSKSTRAWKLERYLIHGVLVLVVVTTLMLWADYATTESLYGTWSNGFRNAYGSYIGAVFSGVVGVGFYPVLGNRVWCRFGCPQAAILGIFQRIFSRFRITTNGGQCMSCGNCSTYCEMGIDVRAYAQRSENIVRASCVGCGVCSAVCPRGVLKLENDRFDDRFEGADVPLAALAQAFREPDVYGYRAWNGRVDN